MDSFGKEMSGWVFDYNAQGMETDSRHVFQDKRFSADGQWDLAGMHDLREGDELTIFATEGAILWSGVVKTRRCGILSLSKLDAGSREWTPQGISWEQWHGWFAHHPPLEAIIKR